jgi:hypothetical protein
MIVIKLQSHAIYGTLSSLNLRMMISVTGECSYALASLLSFQWRHGDLEIQQSFALHVALRASRC